MSVERSIGVLPLLDGSSVLGQTEGQLLARFVAERDERAFEAIVRRHGPMVLGVCRAALPDPGDADDAFQATFLVLARRAGSVRGGARLSPWLYGVARRVARRARSEAIRRRGREVASPELVAAAPGPSAPSAEARELAALLHAELDRLAEPERAAILLCDLEGLTHQEAADRLGWPLGTVKTRLTRGRERLRARLVRRGVAPSAPAPVVAPAVAPGLVAATVRAGSGLAAGRILATGLVSASVASLTQGVVRTMILGKVQAGALILAAAASVVAVPTLLARQGPPPPQPGQPAAVAAPAPGPGEAPPPGESAAALRARMAARVVAEIEAADAGPTPFTDDFRFAWYDRLAQAEVDASPTPAEQIQALRANVARHRRFAAERARRLQEQFARSAPKILEDVANRKPHAAQLDPFWEQAAEIEKPLIAAQEQLTEAQAAAARTAPAARSQAAPPPAGPPPPEPRPALVASEPASRQPESRPDLRQLKISADPRDEKQNRAILAKLDERISMNFPNDTPLSDVIRYIEQATQDEKAGLPRGIPIYVDPRSLKAAGQTESSTVHLNLEGIPLRTTLRLLLDQANLTYVVEGGLLIVLSPDPLRLPISKQGTQ